MGEAEDPEQIQAFTTSIEQVALDRGRSLGLNLEEFEVAAYRLRPADEDYLKDRGFNDLEGIWSVYFRPLAKNQFGGDYTVYFRYPDLVIIEEWLGE